MSEGRFDKAIKKALCDLNDNLANIEIDLTPLTDILTQILDKPDIEFKTLSKTLYCLDGNRYELSICQKFEDGVLTETTEIITGPNGVIPALPEGAEVCQESLIDYEIVSKDICFEDGTSGTKLIKINTITDEVSILGNYDDNGLSTKVVIECPTYQIVESKICTEVSTKI